MKLHYYSDTDSLYIELNATPGADSHEVSDGLIVDVDEAGNPVGFDIDKASARLDLGLLETSGLPELVTKIA
ncbi:MAG: DUF2283 domain-containing protein [Dehalococcoidia bacterium]